jgi:1-acyl-sn-glycerol-3-phosphate acyltransferase
MGLLRAFLFYAGLAAWTLVLGAAFAPTFLMPRRVRARAARFWDLGVLAWLRFTVGLGHRLVGEVPCGAVIVACRHQSAWETFALCALLDDPAVVLKRELLWLPIFGWYLAAVGMIAIDRAGGGAALRRMVRRARRASAEGRPIVVFPEGTRVAPGVRREYHPGVYALYRGLDLPVVPAAVNSGLFWPRRAFAKKPGVITLEFLSAIAPGLGRDDFMRALRARIEAAEESMIAETRRHGAAGKPR